MLSRSDSERQRNLMIHDQRPLPVYFSQVYRIRIVDKSGQAEILLIAFSDRHFFIEILAKTLGQEDKFLIAVSIIIPNI